MNSACVASKLVTFLAIFAMLLTILRPSIPALAACSATGSIAPATGNLTPATESVASPAGVAPPASVATGTKPGASAHMAGHNALAPRRHAPIAANKNHHFANNPLFAANPAATPANARQLPQPTACPLCHVQAPASTPASTCPADPDAPSPGPCCCISLLANLPAAHPPLFYHHTEQLAHQRVTSPPSPAQLPTTPPPETISI